MSSTTDNSWIKLPRNFTKWRWYHDSNMVHLYLYLLLNANLEDEEYNQTLIHRGELITSLPQLASSTSLSIQTIRTCLNKLSKTKEIKCKATHKGRLIILVDFNKFQPIGIDEYCIDWIKLYRQICNWRWYHEPKFLHLFLHFMVQARIVTLETGLGVWQCMTSLSQLSKETGISIRSIRTCITRLQTTGEIIYSTNTTNRKSVITICNYDTYQVSNFESNRQLTDNQQTTNRQLTDNRIDFQKNEKSTQKVTYVNDYKTSSYRNIKKNVNRQLTDNQQTTNRQLTDNQQTTNRQLTAIKEYKNIRKEEEKKIIDIDINNARACEREISEIKENDVSKENEQKKVGKESFSAKVLSEHVWLSAIQKKFKLSGIDAVKQKLEEFELDLICRGRDEHKDEKDFKCHFCDWLAKNLSVPSARVQPTGVKQAGKERWPGEKFVPKSSKGGIYDGPF